MRVYVVWSGEYPDAAILRIFTTHDLAEAYCGDRHRKEWERLEAMSGTPIPRAGVKMAEKDRRGFVVRRWIEPQVLPHPGPFEAWARDRTGLWIEEYEVEERLPDEPR